jgi:hypothetical protein
MTDKEQQGLTPEQVHGMWAAALAEGSEATTPMRFARAIEAKVRQASTAPAGVTPTPELNAILQYLYGAGPLEGHWYGGGHPPGKGAFWWRSMLRAALAGEGTNANSLHLGSSAGKE